MKIYWQERRSGQELVLERDGGEKVTLGGVRKTPRGFDAFATTTGYDPGRAVKGAPSMEEAKAFVESFEPWNLFMEVVDEVTVEPGVRPMVG
ncbi:MAG: hypothetical protein FJ320_01205 [SAR202 cluster bacterium]|nr:hypothetical protein [SAR202 cluster bacterium]